MLSFACSTLERIILQVAVQQPIATLLIVVVALTVVALVALVLRYRIRMRQIEAREHIRVAEVVMSQQLPARFDTRRRHQLFSWLTSRKR